jgi:hypothetical protein
LNNFAKLTLAAVTAVLVSTTLAQASAVRPSLAHRVATCEVAGTPSEFPDDIWITNRGLVTLGAGTKVRWGVDGYAYKGTHTLVADLKPGQGVHLNNVLGNGVEAGRPCTAQAY